MAAPRSTKGRALAIDERLVELYPGSATELCALRHRNAYELLVATILSAQCTDERVNLVMPVMSKRYPHPEDLAAAPLDELESVIRSTGFFRAKAKSLTGMAGALVERYESEVPRELEDLVTLPGVGRKTGNVVRSVAYGLPGLPVDTHVGRLARRLGLTAEDDPVKVELDLNRLLPPDRWGGFSLRLILHGRRICVARKPRCESCVMADLCPTAPPAIRAERARLVRSVAQAGGSLPASPGATDGVHTTTSGGPANGRGTFRKKVAPRPPSRAG